MNSPFLIPVAVATIFFAIVALRSTRLGLGGGALAVTGAGAAAMFFLTGFAGIGVATLACSWGVAAAGQVVGRVITQVEAGRSERAIREPWVVALFSTLILLGALALAIVAVDWPLSPTHASGGAARDSSWASWALAVLGVASAVALSALSPRGEGS